MADIKDIRWKVGVRVKAKAADAYTEIERIRAKHGGVVDPGDVVEESRAKKAPLHDEFQWSDKIAANMHRIETARKLIRSIEIVFEKGPTRPTRAYETRVRTAPATGGKPSVDRKEYASISDVMDNPVDRDELLARAIREAASYRRRYAVLSELSQVFEAIEDVIKSARA